MEGGDGIEIESGRSGCRIGIVDGVSTRIFCTAITNDIDETNVADAV